jgi:nitroimidazol reductase NimA-like FMN-containing flavoprotein (pyridoxamine 5'-phosphate oxidase superfamily)
MARVEHNGVEHNEIEELATSTCWQLLRSVTVGRLALHGVGDDIEIFPVNFVVDRGSVVFKTATGTKLSLAETAARATFEADHFGVDGVAWSVVMKGPTKVIRGHDAVIDSFDVDIHAWQTGRKPIHVRLTPDVVTGRRFAFDPTQGTA